MCNKRNVGKNQIQEKAIENLDIEGKIKFRKQKDVKGSWWVVGWDRMFNEK